MKIYNLIKSEFIKNSKPIKTLIIILILVISSIIIAKISTIKVENMSYSDYSLEISTLEEDYQEKLEQYKVEPSFLNKYHLENINMQLEVYKRLNQDKIDSSSWQATLLTRKISLYSNLILYEEYLNHPDNPELSQFEDNLSLIDLQDIENIINDLQIKLNTIDDVYNSDEYYRYIEYINNEYREDDQKINKYIIDAKIKNEDDWKVTVVKRLRTAYSNYKQEAVDEDSFNPFVSYFNVPTKSYEEYLKIFNKEKELAEEEVKILTYALENNIKPDLSGITPVGNEGAVISTKTILNNGFYLGIVVILIVAITNSGIVASEHNQGTIKLLLTTPNKRWKVLLSKFLYLIIYTVILYLIGYLILTIISIIEFGISDILTPKLIYNGNQVIEVNYILWLLQNICIHTIPMVAVLSIMFFLSTTTLNVALTSSITVMLSLASFVAWYLICIYKLSFFIYTPIPYLSYGDILNKTEYYLNSNLTNIATIDFGLAISIVFIIVFYLLTNLIYVKRDIKN